MWSHSLLKPSNLCWAQRNSPADLMMSLGSRGQAKFYLSSVQLWNSNTQHPTISKRQLNTVCDKELKHRILLRLKQCNVHHAWLVSYYLLALEFSSGLAEGMKEGLYLLVLACGHLKWEPEGKVCSWLSRGLVLSDRMDSAFLNSRLLHKPGRSVSWDHVTVRQTLIPFKLERSTSRLSKRSVKQSRQESCQRWTYPATGAKCMCVYDSTISTSWAFISVLTGLEWWSLKSVHI